MRVPLPLSGLQWQRPRHRAFVGDAGYSILVALVTALVVAVMGCMVVLAGYILRERLCDATALIDVFRAGKAIEKLDPDTPPFAQVVRGLPVVPHLPGLSLSLETTLFVQYRSVGGEPDYLILGSHPRGRTFLYAGGHVYTTKATASSATPWIHWIRDLVTLADAPE